jgi:PKD repeat protein
MVYRKEGIFIFNPFTGFLKSSLLLSVFLLLYIFTFGQVSDGGLPASHRVRLKAAAVIPQKALEALDIDQLKLKDKQEGVDNRYGVLKSLNVNIREEGLQTQVGNMNVWRYKLSSPNAFSLGLQFSTFDIPEGAALYIYSVDGDQIRGGFTNRNIKKSGGLVLAEFPQNELVIEYNEPVDAAFEGGVVLGSVSSGYVDLSTEAVSRIQINCDEGQDWQDHKRAVCMITFNDTQYSYYCSGSLVNNVNEDATPYFLTANHCISSDLEASTLVAYFNYENSSCTSDDASLKQSVSGSELLASGTASDFTLVKLDEDIPAEYEPFFAGWDATDNNPQNGTCIHHPQGTAKCIAIDNDEVQSNSYRIQWDDQSISEIDSHWEVSYDAGADEGGSSGSPLFDENKRIVGQLHGGDDTSSLFGKFSWSWDYRSVSSKQLKYWLDPDNTGIVQLDGFDSTSKPIAAFSPDFNILCLSEVLTLTDESKYGPQTWEWNISPSTYSFVNGTDKNSQNPQVLFSAEGSYTISLTVTNENGADEITETGVVSVFAELPVMLLDLPDEMTMCGWELDNYEFVGEGAPEFAFDITASDKFSTSVVENVLAVSLTDEAKQEGSFDTYVKVTGSQGECSNADSVLVHVVIPANDNVAQAIGLKLGYNGLYANDCATVEDNEPTPVSSDSPDNSIWFYFEGPSNGRVTIHAEGIDSEIAVYRAASAASLLSGSEASYTRLASSAGGSGNTVLEDLEVTPGTEYWLQLDGANGDEGELSIQLLSNTIEVYPNPSTGLYHLTVGSVEDGEAELSVYNQRGQLIYSGTGAFNQKENTVDFNLSGNPAGLYYFRAIINGEVMTKKLLLIR